jgi:hypothetical protein
MDLWTLRTHARRLQLHPKKEYGQEYSKLAFNSLIRIRSLLRGMLPASSAADA